jgi:hypothetical protein
VHGHRAGEAGSARLQAGARGRAALREAQIVHASTRLLRKLRGGAAGLHTGTRRLLPQGGFFDSVSHGRLEKGAVRRGRLQPSGCAGHRRRGRTKCGWQGRRGSGGLRATAGRRGARSPGLVELLFQRQLDYFECAAT